MSKTLVAVVDTVFPTLDPARDVLAKVDAELVMAEQPTPDSILSVASEADAVLVTYGKITSEVIDGLKNCKVIICLGKVAFDTCVNFYKYNYRLINKFIFMISK